MATTPATTTNCTLRLLQTGDKLCRSRGEGIGTGAGTVVAVKVNDGETAAAAAAASNNKKNNNNRACLTMTRVPA